MRIENCPPTYQNTRNDFKPLMQSERTTKYSSINWGFGVLGVPGFWGFGAAVRDRPRAISSMERLTTRGVTFRWPGHGLPTEPVPEQHRRARIPRGDRGSRAEVDPSRCAPRVWSFRVRPEARAWDRRSRSRRRTDRRGIRCLRRSRRSSKVESVVRCSHL